MDKFKAALEHDVDRVEEVIESMSKGLIKPEHIRHPHFADSHNLSSSRAAAVASSAAHTRSAVGGDEEEDEEEEGWASDQSNSDLPQPSTSTLQDRRKRSKSPKTKPVSPKLAIGVGPSAAAPGKKNRRRNSIRRGLIGHAQQFMRSTHAENNARPSSSSSAVFDENAEGDDRGRLTHHHHSSSVSSQNSRPGTAPGSLRNFRIDSLRAQHSPSSREGSPTRSVRFMDNQRRYSASASGSTTPRLQGGESSGRATPPVQQGDSDEQLDSARNRVTFEIPPKP